jgi:L-amino acid N-acyltransferase YncA
MSRCGAAFGAGHRVTAARHLDLQAGIFPENTASIRLHRRLDFVSRDRIGRMAGRWRDWF